MSMTVRCACWATAHVWYRCTRCPVMPCWPLALPVQLSIAMRTMLGSSTVCFGAGGSQPCRTQCGTSERSLQHSRSPHSTSRSVLVRARSKKLSEPWPLAPSRVERAASALESDFIKPDKPDDWKELKHYRLKDGGAALVDDEIGHDIYVHEVHAPHCIERFVAGFLVTAKPNKIAALTSAIPEQYILQRATEISAPKRPAASCMFANPVSTLAALYISLVAAWWNIRSKRMAIAEKQETQELQAVLKDKIHADSMKLVIVLLVAVGVAVFWHMAVTPTLMAFGKQMSRGFDAAGTSM